MFLCRFEVLAAAALHLSGGVDQRWGGRGEVGGEGQQLSYRRRNCHRRRSTIWSDLGPLTGSGAAAGRRPFSQSTLRAVFRVSSDTRAPPQCHRGVTPPHCRFITSCFFLPCSLYGLSFETHSCWSFTLIRRLIETSTLENRLEKNNRTIDRKWHWDLLRGDDCWDKIGIVIFPTTVAEKFSSLMWQSATAAPPTK